MTIRRMRIANFLYYIHVTVLDRAIGLENLFLDKLLYDGKFALTNFCTSRIKFFAILYTKRLFHSQALVIYYIYYNGNIFI